MIRDMHFQARKRFGQHFLHDKQIIQQLIHVIAPQSSQHFVEIGPGQGALTVPLLYYGPEFDAIEIDKDLIPALSIRCSRKGNLTIHEADVLKFDFKKLVREEKPLRVVGNVPYNISTPLIFHVLNYADCITDIHFMLQEEVVQRLAARPNEEHYGRLSVMVQYHADVIALFPVLPSAFYPPPEVHSRVVRLIPYRDTPHLAQNYLHFSSIVKEAFSQRRKTLRNSLKNTVTDSDWASIGISSQQRAEQLSVEDYVKISNHFFKK